MTGINDQLRTLQSHGRIQRMGLVFGDRFARNQDKKAHLHPMAADISEQDSMVQCLKQRAQHLRHEIADLEGYCTRFNIILMAKQKGQEKNHEDKTTLMKDNFGLDPTNIKEGKCQASESGESAVQ